MSLIEELYSQTPENVQSIWEKFLFFHPDLRYLRSKQARQASATADSFFLVRQIRNIYLPLPLKTPQDIQEIFRQAMNRGIASINRLCRQHLEEKAEQFLIPDVPFPLDFNRLTEEARNLWIEAKSGTHNGSAKTTLRGAPVKKPDYIKISKAYNAVRSWGLGYHVLMIDESPEVIASIRNYHLAREWFSETFGFRNPKKTGSETLPQAWQTNADVRVYGVDFPVRTRLKVLDGKTGMPHYSSIIMKMLSKGGFPDHIRDYTGVEFIVEDLSAMEKLLSFFQLSLRGTTKLESFKRTRRRKDGDNKSSSPEFDCTKFIIRPPVPILSAVYASHPGYERIPVEIQILTLEADKQRRENPDVKHEEYKRRQFREVFPILFPRAIYEPLLLSS